MILVDSSVWIDYFNGNRSWQTDLLEKCLSGEPIVMGNLILTEILQGFRSDKDYKTAKSFLNALPFRQMGVLRCGHSERTKLPQTSKSRSCRQKDNRCHHCNLVYAGGIDITP